MKQDFTVVVDKLQIEFGTHEILKIYHPLRDFLIDTGVMNQSLALQPRLSELSGTFRVDAFGHCSGLAVNHCFIPAMFPHGNLNLNNSSQCHLMSLKSKLVRFMLRYIFIEWNFYISYRNCFIIRF